MELSNEARNKARIQLNYLLRVVGDNRTYNDVLYKKGLITGEDVLEMGGFYSEISEMITDIRTDVEEGADE